MNKYWKKQKELKYNEYYNYKIESLKDEIWKDIVDYEGYYQVSNFGRIKSLTRVSVYYNAIYKENKERIRKEHIMKTYTPKNRYTSVVLTKNGIEKTYSIHRLVAEAFIPNLENKPQVNHKDGDKTNNNVNNLEWVTINENMQHAFNTGLNKPNQNKKVNQYDLQDNFIKQWDCITDFLRENNKSLKSSCISCCCSGKLKTAYGYKWKYADK